MPVLLVNLLQNVVYSLFDLLPVSIVTVNRGSTNGFTKPGRAGIRIRRLNESFPRDGIKSQLGSKFYGSVPIRPANDTGDVAKTNAVTGVCVWLIELRVIGYAERLGAFSVALVTLAVRNRTGRPAPASDSRRPRP